MQNAVQMARRVPADAGTVRLSGALPPRRAVALAGSLLAAASGTAVAQGENGYTRSAELIDAMAGLVELQTRAIETGFQNHCWDEPSTGFAKLRDPEDGEGAVMREQYEHVVTKWSAAPVRAMSLTVPGFSLEDTTFGMVNTR